MDAPNKAGIDAAATAALTSVEVRNQVVMDAKAVRKQAVRQTAIQQAVVAAAQQSANSAAQQPAGTLAAKEPKRATFE